jgi:predicted nucleic acid-binding Zn ribbon protein
VNEKRRKPVPIAEALTGFLTRRGLSKRIEQAEAVVDWPSAVGAQIAAVTQPISITPDGTLFIAVTTHSWMTELSLMEPDLLAALNKVEGRAKVRKIRFQLRR